MDSLVGWRGDHSSRIIEHQNLNDRGMAFCQRSCFVEDNNIDRFKLFKSTAASNQQALTACSCEGGHNGRWNRDTKTRSKVEHQQ